MTDRIFREYDIRGVFGKDLTVEVVELLGKAYATYLSGKAATRLKVSVGRDVRLSSAALRDALIKGITLMGVDVVDIGKCPTPLQYFSLYHLNLDGGVMITGSHNPPEYNGFKLSVGNKTIYGKEIQEIKRLMREIKQPEGISTGVVEEYEIIPPYIDYQLNGFSTMRLTDLKNPIKLAVDAGNGTAGLVVPALLRKLGCDVLDIYTEPDGMFPNHHPDPTIEENLTDLIELVKKEADFGVAYDGDSDRIGVVDETGRIIWRDQLMIIFARDIISHSKKEETFIGEVKCSQIMYDEIERLGGKAIMWKTGHSLIKAKMSEIGAALGGEMSGHIFFADRYFGYDDAIYATIRILEILYKLRRTVPDAKFSDLLNEVPQTYTTPELRVDTSDEKKFQVIKALSSIIENDKRTLSISEIIRVDGLRIVFEDGWALVRASNTQPVLVLRFEAATEKRLKQIRVEIEERLSQAIQNLAP